MVAWQLLFLRTDEDRRIRCQRSDGKRCFVSSAKNCVFGISLFSGVQHVCMMDVSATEREGRAGGLSCHIFGREYCSTEEWCCASPPSAVPRTAARPPGSVPVEVVDERSGQPIMCSLRVLSIANTYNASVWAMKPFRKYNLPVWPCLIAFAGD